jgi:AcrR family transcriptional regulator
MAQQAESQPGSRRERLKREREDSILDAAAEVFASKGFHQATIREIALAADVADGTIYNYFADKADLLIGIMARLAEVERLPDELSHALKGDPRGFFVEAFRHRLARMTEGQQMLRAILPEVLVNEELRAEFHQHYIARITELLERYVHAQIRLGQIRAVDVALTVRLVIATFIGLLFMRSFGDEPLLSNWDLVPESLAVLVFDGLNPEGDKLAGAGQRPACAFMAGDGA